MKSKVIFLVLFALSSLTVLAAPPSKREAQIETILELTQANICNPYFLETPQWQEFVTTLEQAKTLKLNDEEFARLFNQASKKLPFSHYYLNYTKGGSSTSMKNFSLEEIDGNTALMNVRSWSRDPQAMIQVIGQIESKGYSKLIIDLRDNTGGTLDAAVILGQYLTNQTIDAGTYITRSWFEKTEAYPTQSEIGQLDYMKELSYDAFGQMLQQPAFRMIIPGHNNSVFKGEVVVLVNEHTASTNEPLVHLIQQYGLGTLVGTKTAGNMMSGKFFKVSKKLRLFLPVADYVTAEGIRLDQVGVTPDVQVSSAQALNKAKELLGL
ncbi:S41 family peptidase [Gilvibacter sediminis]|uniref:S41 family peptidase n=1 Tax=Gilvibacter sediminis TaxID=379071 RepID=UPI00234FD9B5|nr:S41 family peptidase [Gilvibacter sediminis]MDC7997137.1 S41 family peptidase [Gilvibacter sediminis]